MTTSPQQMNAVACHFIRSIAGNIKDGALTLFGRDYQEQENYKEQRS
jgi:galactose mutarotase-like enzyme